jgi:hypothetical protein
MSGDTKLGALLGHRTYTTAEIVTLTANVKNVGIGTALEAAFVEAVSKGGATMIFLNSIPTSKGFYIKRGYICTTKKGNKMFLCKKTIVPSKGAPRW